MNRDKEKNELLQWDHFGNAIPINESSQTYSTHHSEQQQQEHLQLQIQDDAAAQDGRDWSQGATPFPTHPHLHSGPLTNDGLEAMFEFSRQAQCKFTNSLYACYILLCFLSGLLMILTIAGPIGI
jgi:hypothetical protein